ncbi:cation diffusion facilitator 9 [Piromyces finnis]|uniref:Cation diffusion facilitator 9 n=1 Tax=Piromyces finnis TaxID=1754191 RepID=A0A1Y1V5Y9_9FUNG|nr:cation diffusion facilitator 9 [Piromyces finnis]|eukprot:ORX47263.1 cation diffusion facilitator 9 [Piromyces finnis]
MRIKRDDSNIDNDESSRLHEIIDISDASFNFDIDENLFTENRGDWTMNDFEMKTKDHKKKMNRKLKNYYSEQKNLIEQFSNIDDMLGCIQRGEEYSFDEVDSQSFRARMAIAVSFVANIVLLLLKAVALARTGSLAVLTSLVDSILDLLSGSVLFFSNRAISKANALDYPTGMERLEPLSVIVFSCITACSSLEIITEAVGNLVSSDSSKISMDWVDIGLLITIVVTKFLLWVWCKKITESTSVQALAQDHSNDILFNVVTTIIAIIASKTVNFIDPLGAILLSIYIIINWIKTALYYIKMMTGTTATPEEIQKLTYLACRYDSRVVKIDTVRAYHVGVKLFVEIDIVLNKDVPLVEAHDVGECLQELIEKFPEVERAFVHIDYDYFHKIEHNKNNSLITNDSKTKNKFSFGKSSNNDNTSDATSSNI